MNIANQTLRASNFGSNLPLGHTGGENVFNDVFPIHSKTISQKRFLCNRQSDQDMYNNCNMNIGDNIRRRRKELGWNQKQLAARSGLSQTTISDIERGRNDSSTGLHDIAKAMSISVEQLIKGNWNISMDIVSKQPSVDAYIEGQCINVTTTIMRNVPLISWVQAGDFCEAIDNLHPNDAEDWMPTEYAVRAHTYALRVVGDSMTPDFPEGTVLIVEPTEDVRHGRYVIAKRGNDVTFKQAVQDGTKWYLKPLNKAYPTVEMTEDTMICGIVVETLARRKTI